MFHDMMHFFALLLFAIQVLGVLTAFHAVMNVRTSQGAIAWAVSLIEFPWLAIPFYWVFGKNKFEGYLEALKKKGKGYDQEALLRQVAPFRVRLDNSVHAAFGAITPLPFTSGNNAELLIDGHEAFAAIFAAIEEARDYVLLEFYIVNDDKLGNELKNLLIRKVQQGVRVYFLYDEIGSTRMTKKYIDDISVGGVVMRGFTTTRGRHNRFQLNFRNHRKITIIDGQVAYIGGLNIGDEYLGYHPKLGPWRDTHVQILGPAVQCIQTVFVDDWYWATEETLDLKWMPRQSDHGSQNILTLASGPADVLESGALFFVNIINAAKRRLWISTPYFVPDDAVVTALQLAALRGVDVRLIMPTRPDHWLVYLASFSFMPQMNIPGIRIYHYDPGFLHQKAVLVDDDLAAIGTANLDNRSLRLNFEITILVADLAFAQSVEKMLEQDLRQSHLFTLADYQKRKASFKIAVKTARLLAPIL